MKKEILTFNQKKLENFIKKAKKGDVFLYKPEVGFTNGFLFLVDGPQLQGTVKKETMVITEIMHGRANFDLKALREKYEKNQDELIPVKPTMIYLKRDMDNSILRMFKSDDGNFLINTKFSEILEEKNIYKPKLYTDSSKKIMYFFDVDDKFGGFILGVANDNYQRILNQIKEVW